MQIIVYVEQYPWEDVDKFPGNLYVPVPKSQGGL